MRSFSHRMSFGGVVYSASIFEALSPTSCEGNFFLVSCVYLKFFVWPTNQAIFFASTPFLNLAPAASWFSDTGKIAATCRVYPFIYWPLAHLPICFIYYLRVRRQAIFICGRAGALLLLDRWNGGLECTQQCTQWRDFWILYVWVWTARNIHRSCTLHSNIPDCSLPVFQPH